MAPRKSKVKDIKRDASGLLTGVDYVFNEEGLVDWRKMVKTDYLVPNRQRTKETDVSKLEDKDLLILLGGIKELAQIRGFKNLEYNVQSPSPEYVVASCKITWLPNFETEGNEVTFSAIGDASPSNTSSFAKFFLGPIAENRAFVRCVRNFLRINIVGQDEMGNVKVMDEPEPDNPSDPRYLLQRVMKEKGVSFEQVKKKLLKEEFKGAETLQSIEDIPKNKIFELIERLKKV
tara:strand:+ start:32273 stop:32971 length:699 start_codon:yes stop_codon:yes gene_type:complete